MTVTVSIDNKKQFIRDLLNHFQMKRRECVWILNYLASGHDSLLENVHFVDDVAGLDNAFTMTTHNSDKRAFNFSLKGKNIDDAERAFHHLRLNPDEQFYIKIEADKSLMLLDSYNEVIESNPKAKVPTEFSKEAEAFLDKAILDFKINSLKDKIDEALDKRSKRNFNKYTKELKKLLEG